MNALAECEIIARKVAMTRRCGCDDRSNPEAPRRRTRRGWNKRKDFRACNFPYKTKDIAVARVFFETCELNARVRSTLTDARVNKRTD